MDTKWSRVPESYPLYLLLLAAIIAVSLIPHHWYRGPNELMLLTYPAIWSLRGIMAALLALSVAVFPRDYSGSKRERLRQRGVAMVVCYSITAFLIFSLNLFSFLAPLVRWAHTDGRDGRTYCAFRIRWLEGELFISSITSSSLLAECHEVQARCELPRSWTTLVRPQALQFTPPQLIATATTPPVLLGVDKPGSCYFLYDVAAKEFMTPAARVDVSPFLLLGPTDVPSPVDVEGVLVGLRAARSTDQFAHLLLAPSPEVLEAGVRNANPAISRIAAQMVAASAESR